MWDGFKKLIIGKCNTNSLVLITTVLTLIYAIETIYLNNMTTYLEALIIILYFQKIAQYIEYRRVIKMNSEIKQIATTNIQRVKRIVNGSHEEIKLEDLEVNDNIICLPGDKVFVDGILKEGTTHFDESPITGSSIPIEKNKNSRIISGSVNCENEISYIVEKKVKDSYISILKEQLVEDLKKKQKGSKRIDRFCNFFVPFVIIGVIILFALVLLQTDEI